MLPKSRCIWSFTRIWQPSSKRLYWLTPPPAPVGTPAALHPHHMWRPFHFSLYALLLGACKCLVESVSAWYVCKCLCVCKCSAVLICISLISYHWYLCISLMMRNNFHGLICMSCCHCFFFCETLVQVFLLIFKRLSAYFSLGCRSSEYILSWALCHIHTHTTFLVWPL